MAESSEWALQKANKIARGYVEIPYDWRQVLSRDIALALDAARKEVIKEADRIYNCMWEERAKDGNDEFTSALLAGMTELMNAIRALLYKPPAPPSDG